jgi:hypothetical protein
MIHPFEDNYFFTPQRKLFKLPAKSTHSQWLDETMPGETRESVCEKGWIVIRTMRDRHVMQLSGMDYSKLRTIGDILMELPPKDILVIQSGPHTAFQISFREFCELDGPEQLWSYTMMGFGARI